MTNTVIRLRSRSMYSSRAGGWRDGCGKTGVTGGAVWTVLSVMIHGTSKRGEWFAAKPVTRPRLQTHKTEIKPYGEDREGGPRGWARSQHPPQTSGPTPHFGTGGSIQLRSSRLISAKNHRWML